MKKVAIMGLAAALMGGAIVLKAQNEPATSEPAREYRVLKELVGEWEFDSEAILEPGKPPMKSSGTESVRAIGESWVISETKGTVFDLPFTGIMTIGYNTQKKRHIATWIDSMNSHLLRYDGTLDEAGNVLTLLTEGPDPTSPGKTRKFKDVIELKSKEHKTLTSYIQGDDGKWMTFLTVNYRRKK